MLICILTKNVITSCSVTMMLFLHLEVKPLMTLTTVLYLSCALISGHLAMMLMELSFFLQAEDVIRDDLVTGVQTCALPISAPLVHHTLDSTHIAQGVVGGAIDAWAFTLEASAFHGREPDEHRYGVTPGALDSYATRRSEERRVGKERGSREAPHDAQERAQS